MLYNFHVAAKADIYPFQATKLLALDALSHACVSLFTQRQPIRVVIKAKWIL